MPASLFDNSLQGIYILTGGEPRKIIGISEDVEPELHESVYQRWHDRQLPYRPENLAPFKHILDARKF